MSDSSRHHQIAAVARRSFILTSWSLVAGIPATAAGFGFRPQALESSDALPASFPTQPPELVKEMVTVAHGNVARVKALIARHQTLAKAAWDWGFGDWESALGAASHVGNREIAEFLLANGARPSIFSAAMLGQLGVVRAFVTASPGTQRIHGPHSITLLKHALAGGAQAKAVADYLMSIGGSDEKPAEQPLTAEDRAKLAGVYPFGASSAESLEIVIAKEQLTIGRPGGVPRGLSHLGAYDFYPMGAQNVRVRFRESAGVVTMTIHDPDIVVTATKRSAG